MYHNNNTNKSLLLKKQQLHEPSRANISTAPTLMMNASVVSMKSNLNRHHKQGSNNAMLII